ncbi:uncharacterized protein [Eurosta solidaginis]|uniref:uncharacterized protein n=1 Tax=Eurosta solidaginis TaxID=178769 RepID=UPI003531566E
METTNIKQLFLDNNTDYKEVKPSKELAAIGEFQNVDEIKDEVWLLQCPKGLDIDTELQGQKLKLPGRTNFNTAETVAVEYAEPQKRAFGFCNRKGRYSLRLLPIKGNILLRGRLKGSEAVTLEHAESICPPEERVSLPDMIKVRHPLHGHQFDKSIRVDKRIADRLKKADKISAAVLHEALTNRQYLRNLNTESMKSKHHYNNNNNKQNLKASAAATADDDDDTCVSVTNLKKRKKKPKHSYNAAADKVEEVISKKKRKMQKISEDVTTDMQWLEDIIKIE